MKFYFSGLLFFSFIKLYSVYIIIIYIVPSFDGFLHDLILAPTKNRCLLSPPPFFFLQVFG